MNRRQPLRRGMLPQFVVVMAGCRGDSYAGRQGVGEPGRADGGRSIGIGQGKADVSMSPPGRIGFRD